MKILDDLKALGYSVILEGDNIRLRYIGIGDHPVEAGPLIEELRQRKGEAIAYLKETSPLPFFEADGSLVISFGCDGRFHFWDGGQSIADTVREVKAWVH